MENLSFNSIIRSKKLISLFILSIVELLTIIALIAIYRLDFFHKITLKRISKEMARQDAFHEQQLIAMGLNTEDNLKQ
jgi:hypothetical protein